MNSTTRSKPNTHLSTPGTNSDFSPVHIFTPNPSTELTQQLTNASIPHVLHNRPKDLDSLLASRPSNSKLVVLVETGADHHNSTQGGFLFPPHYKFPRSLENTYFSFYSLTLSSTREVLQGAKQAVDYCVRCLGKDHKRIQLRSVHSLSTSRDKTFRSHRSPQPTRTSEKPQYSQLLYLQDTSSQIRSSTNYRLFVASLDGMQKATPFDSFQELTLKLKNRQKRALVLTNNYEIPVLLEMLKKQSIINFDLILLGLLEPNALYLSPHIVLATNDSTMISRFIQQQGFRFPPPPEDMKRSQRFSMSSTDFKNIMHKIMKEDSEHSSSNNVFRSTFRSGTRVDSKPVRHWRVDKDPQDNSSFLTSEVVDSKINFAEFGDKRKPKRFKSPVKSIFSVQSEQSHQPLLQSIYKKPSQPQSPYTPRSKDTPMYNTDEFGTKKNSPSIQPIFSYDNYYKHPISNIIPEVSDEYRGSNKQSVMNIEASLQSKNFKQQASGSQNQSQYRSTTRLEEHLLKTGNQSWKYLNSQNSISSTQRINTDGKIGSQNSLKHLVDTKGPEIINDRTPNKSPLRVVRKTDIVSPEQVKNSAQRLPEPTERTSRVINKYPRNDAHFPPKYAQYRATIAARTAGNHVSPSEVPKTHKQENKPGSPKNVHPSFQNSYNRQFQGFERVQKDGVVVYRRKVTHEAEPLNSKKLLTSNKSSPSLTPRAIHTPIEPNHTPQKSIKKEVVDQTHKKTNTTEQSRYNSKYYLNSPQSNSTSILPFKSTIKPNGVQKPGNGRSPAYMNDSMFSRMSELHSDGSILRRNNMRFGVKLKKKEEPEPSMLWQQSKITSGIYKPIENNRKNALNRLLVGEQTIEQERNKLHHVNTRFNNFHFLVHEELSYLNGILENHLKGPSDKLQKFISLQDMFECIRPEKTSDLFDGGFIFTLKHHLPLINPKILPQDYYLIVVDRFKGALLEVNQEARRIRLDHLGHLSLVEKIIIDSKLYQYVAYGSHRKQIETLADKFLKTEFVLQKIQTQFSSQIIDFYYCELPRLTRLYILCGKQQLPELIRLMDIYQEFNPAFDPQSVKLICLIGNILQNDDLIMDHPSVTFINNPEDIKNYTDILRYAHYTEDPKQPFILDHFFYHHRHAQLEPKLDTAFPGRFQLCPFNKLSQIYPKIDRINKINNNRGLPKLKHYMLLPDNLGGQKLSTQHFYKIFMLGKGKSVQSSIVRVLNLQELVQLLKI